MTWFSWVIAISLVLLPCSLSAETKVPLRHTSPVTSASLRVADVTLKCGGVLQGQVVDQAGLGMADAFVQLTNAHQQWQTETDVQGRFSIANLRGGSYQLQAGGQSQILRAWTANTAPPSANQGVLFASSADVVRGQRVVSGNTNQFFRVSKERLANPWIFGGVVATAVAIPVAIHNSGDDNPPATP